MKKITDAPYITFSELKVLRHAPGILEIDIKQIDDYFMPFVLFTRRGQEPVTHGTIVMDGKAMACLNLNELIIELQASLGSDLPINVYKSAETTLH